MMGKFMKEEMENGLGTANGGQKNARSSAGRFLLLHHCLLYSFGAFVVFGRLLFHGLNLQNGKPSRVNERTSEYQVHTTT